MRDWPSEMSRRVTTRVDITAVIALYKANHELRDISAQTGVRLRVVHKLVKSYRELGEDMLPFPLPKSGRPKLLSLRTLEVISRQINTRSERETPVFSATSPYAVFGNPYVIPLDLKASVHCRKPLLTERPKENRVKFCKKCAVWGLGSWRSVLWSDMAKIFLDWQ
ncbi:putative Transposable element Tcb1 transposase-like 10, partial [Homarus americanus]